MDKKSCPFCGKPVSFGLDRCPFCREAIPTVRLGRMRAVAPVTDGPISGGVCFGRCWRE